MYCVTVTKFDGKLIKLCWLFRSLWSKILSLTPTHLQTWHITTHKDSWTIVHQSVEPSWFGWWARRRRKTRFYTSGRDTETCQCTGVRQRTRKLLLLSGDDLYFVGMYDRMLPFYLLYTLTLTLTLSLSLSLTHSLTHSLSHLFFCRFNQHPALILTQSCLHRQNMPSTGGRLNYIHDRCLYVIRSSNAIAFQSGTHIRFSPSQVSCINRPGGVSAGGSESLGTS